MIIYVYIK